jgi:hypothetical protein
MDKKLFDQLTRLLLYSGSEIKEKSITNDGATAVVDFGGEDIRIFVAPVNKIKRRELKTDAPELHY